ncbi:MAG: HDIG domain-containing protein, partial [Thermodesulfobacteriota bacterium]|nr:HDIG domain-containing protein [Thermodesulfobacteriota bacterium]
MNTPSKKECDRLFHSTGMLANIVEHSRQVCRVATFLTDQLRKADIFLCRELIAAAALLHDITKTRSFDTGEDHTRTGEELLSRLGYNEVGKIVGQHVALDTYFSSDVPDEAEIV